MISIEEGIVFNITSEVLIGTGAIYNQLGEALPKASIVTYIACFFFYSGNKSL